MEESSNRNSSSWQEDIYWHNFHFVHFSLTLPFDFHHHLKLPTKFTEYMRTKLPEQIALKVNRNSWNVDLEKGKGDIVLQGDGWKEFVNAYSLQKKDILVFKYNRQECFEVFLFDGASLCEKEASYFVRKDQQKEYSNGEEGDCARRKETKEKLSKGHTATPRNRNRINPGRTAKRCSFPNTCTEDGFDDQDEMDKTSDEENSTSEEVITTPKNTLLKRKRNVVNMSTPKKNTAIYALRFKSNRREVTPLEIENALRKAKEASLSSTNSFMVVMRPGGVYRRFFMTIPAEWRPRNVLKKGQEILLKVENKTWECKVVYTASNAGIEGVGWKDFARDNFLEEDDVCVFVPSDSINGSYALDVSIFRVVPEVVSATQI